MLIGFAAAPEPHGYLFPPSHTETIRKLHKEEITVEELREDIELDIQVYRIDKIEKRSMEVTRRKETRRVKAGTLLVRTDQRRGKRAGELLAPQSPDSLFRESVREGADYPVLVLPAATPLTSAPVPAAKEKPARRKRIELDMLLGKKPMPNLSGSPIADVAWLDDGEHFVQRKEGRFWKVHAASGRAQPQPGREVAKITAALAALPTFDAETARRTAERIAARPWDGKPGEIFSHGDDLYFYRADGSKAIRLTRSAGAEEVPSLSPDGKFAAFVRGNNLCVVDVATQTERALTEDGSAVVSNGKMDWVYWEEIGNRFGKAYGWSPDSSRLAFVRYDDSPVHKYTVIDHLPTRQRVETTPYPKAGDPIPAVKLGVVAVSGGPVAWVDLRGYSDGAMILTRAGWLPDGKGVYFYVQDRAQTWLDFCTAPRGGGEPTRLFRDRTRAWVSDPGPPHFLKDGSFLLPSERSGWRHLYHFAADGKLKRAVTEGAWEVRDLHRVEESTGWVYFSATRDNPTGLDLYRVPLAGGEVQRLTTGPGTHRASVGPGAKYFVDHHSAHEAPATARLYKGDGTPARTLDTNPVRARDEYDLGGLEVVHIPTADGFVLEGTLLKPPDFDPSRRYPVWLMTYGGPHTPVVRDAWQGGRLRDRGLANLGFLVFQVDPRSASGKGACSTWTAYRQLGVQELADLETAVRWLAKKPFVDASRVGLSGHSYGGFLTAYALTHSQLFAAGAAGAPVTDWHNYDAFYTERYMNTPQENPDGYARTSVVRAAAKLHGRLLLVHGITDDNVHVQNTLQLVRALQKADRDFELMVYPTERHGIRDRHYQRVVIDFMRRTLRP